MYLLDEEHLCDSDTFLNRVLIIKLYHSMYLLDEEHLCDSNAFLNRVLITKLS